MNSTPSSTGTPKPAAGKTEPVKATEMFVVGQIVTEGQCMNFKVSLATDGMLGMLPVFASRKDAERFAPNFPIFSLAYSTNQSHP